MRRLLGCVLGITLVSLLHATANAEELIELNCSSKEISKLQLKPFDGLQEFGTLGTWEVRWNEQFMLAKYPKKPDVLKFDLKTGQNFHGTISGDGKEKNWKVKKWEEIGTCKIINLTALKKRQSDAQARVEGALRELQARAKQGDVNAQYKLGTMYDQGEGVLQDNQSAMKWYRLAAKQGNPDAQNRFSVLVLQDIVYGSDIRKLENLRKSVETLCIRNIKCAFDKVWEYLDITKDGHLSLSEIARFQRNIIKFIAVHQDGNVLKTEEIAAINLTSIIFLPIMASSVIHSFDYNNDGLLSKSEVLDDTEFAKLVGVDVNTLATGLEFQSLGKKLQDAMGNIPFLK